MNAPDKVRSLAELPREIEPPRDLWPQIEARLEPARPGKPGLVHGARGAPLTRLRWLAAAAMVASVAVGVWIGRDFVPLPGGAAPVQPPTTQATTAATKPAPPAYEGATALDARFVSDPRYARDRAALLKSLQERLAAMPPESREKVSKSLATIQAAKEDLESALGKDPSNALLQELLINTYQDEMRALAAVHEASDPGRGI